MRKKLIIAPITLVASLALVFGPALADDVETDDPEDCTAVQDDTDTDVDTDVDTDTDTDVVEEAALQASAAADDLEDGDACPELETGHERAVVAWQAAIDRLSVEGAGGNGVAADVLTALINGESPSGIGAAHGAAMAQAAADRRAENQDDEDTSDDDEADSSGKPEHAGPPAGHGRP